MTALPKLLSASLAVASILLAAQPAGAASPLPTPKYYGWMSTDVITAWSSKYFGQGVKVTVVDDYSSNSKFYGNFGPGLQLQRHGEWTREEIGLLAPSATIISKDFTTGTAVTLQPGLNVLNLSYGMYARAGYSAINWSREEASIISYAKNGQAVISKAAGNDAVAIGSANSSGQLDYLDTALIGAQSAIFVGALTSNGSPTKKATLASYSDTAGTNVNVQKHFLVVGVQSSTTGLAGTSFAAPVITGYAAILGSKFTTANATQITNQLLNTARKDTLVNYNAATFGQGEASLANALAPMSIR